MKNITALYTATGLDVRGTISLTSVPPSKGRGTSGKYLTRRGGWVSDHRNQENSESIRVLLDQKMNCYIPFYIIFQPFLSKSDII